MGTSINALPQVPVSVSPLPSVGVTTLPSGLVPYVPPRITVDAYGEGLSEALVSGAYVLFPEATSSGSSSVDILPVQYRTADAYGEGTSDPDTVEGGILVAHATSEGSSTADTAVALSSEAFGAGESSADLATRIDSEASGSGSATANVTLVGILIPNTSGEGTSTAEVATFTPSGMNKSGTQSIAAGSSTSYTQVTGWSADTANYPGSTVSSNSLVVQSDHAGAKIQASVRVSSTLNSTTTARLRKNGVLIGSAGATTSSSTNRVATVEVIEPVSAGDLIAVEIVQGTFTSHTVQASDTWVRVLDNAPPPEPTLVAQDDFNRSSLGSDWNTVGGGTLYLSGNQLCGVGMPSTPMSYAFWHEEVDSDTQIVEATVRWNGRDPEHSAVAVVVRANPSSSPTVGWDGVQFWMTADLMGILYIDPSAPNGFRPATGTSDYVAVSKIADGSTIWLKAEDDTYTAYINGSQVLQGTISTDIIPVTHHVVGVMIQDDSAVAGGGEPPANLDDWKAYIL